uniref:Bm8696 n=1 Tax=Brugia malayi TaxID=6279 RepID=A0A0H5S350_BRUMA|nr:Bm8696 [Brugia malayi]
MDRLSKEIEKYLQENFNRELSNPKKERSISYESNDEEDQEYQSSDTTLSDSKFNQPNVPTTTNYNASLQAVPPSNYQSQLAESVEKNIETEQNSSSFLLNATNKRNLNYEFQSQNSPLAIAEDGEKQKGILDTSILPKPGNCPPLNPLLHSLPHNDTDKSCGQTLTGSSVDPNCACMYFVAERNEKGCAAKFYILCYRSSDQHPDQIIEESFAPQVPNTYSEQNAETHSDEQVDNYNQQSVNYNKQKLRRRTETINQTFPLDKEAELKEDKAQTTTINSTTKSASVKHQ